MAHEEYVRIVSGAKTAVLFMHGIAGSPSHFRELMPLESLVPAQWSVYNVLMDGHGKGVEDFSRSSMKKWKDQVMGIFDDLCRIHEQVIVVGHSMGTLFAVQMAFRRPKKVPFIFLIACPLRVGVRLFGAINLIKMSFGCLNRNDPVQAATAKVSSITQTRRSWKYLGWLPRLAELLREMRYTEKRLPDLRVSCIAYQSRRDELVSNRSYRILENNDWVEVHDLLQSTHFYYAPEDISTVQKRFCEMIEAAGSI